MPPSRFEPWEIHYSEQGFSLIAGVDEVGRGCLAGPVVAAAVILPKTHAIQGIQGIDDSKKLSPESRSLLFPQIIRDCVSFGIGIVSVDVIDTINILQASLLAMQQAVLRLRKIPNLVLVDGKQKIPALRCAQETLIDGDARCLSIAAASIIAKVTRDRLISHCDRDYPQYGFSRHKGYGTPEHQEALKLHGPTPLHRRSFAPVRNLL